MYFVCFSDEITEMYRIIQNIQKCTELYKDVEKCIILKNNIKIN